MTCRDHFIIFIISADRGLMALESPFIAPAVSPTNLHSRKHYGNTFLKSLIVQPLFTLSPDSLSERLCCAG